MSEVNKPVETEMQQPLTDKPEVAIQPTLSELQKQFEESQTAIKAKEKEFAEKELELQKKISGLDRKNSEYQKQVEEERLSKLQGEELALEKLRIIEEKVKQGERENAELNRKRIIDSELFNSGIPSEFAKRINGQTPEEIQADVKEFNDFINKRVIELKEKAVNDALSGKAPEVGNLKKLNEREQLISKYNDAEKRGDGAAMFQIKEKIRSLPKE